MPGSVTVAPVEESALATDTLATFSFANTSSPASRQRSFRESPASPLSAPSASEHCTVALSCVLSSEGVRVTVSAVTVGRYRISSTGIPVDALGYTSKIDPEPGSYIALRKTFGVHTCAPLSPGSGIGSVNAKAVSYTHLDVYKRQGLGLSIVRQIVLLHDGDIQAQSEENKGSVFTIELPIATKQVKP